MSSFQDPSELILNRIRNPVSRRERELAIERIAAQGKAAGIADEANPAMGLMASQQVSSIIEEAMQLPAGGNIFTDTGNILQSTWAGLEIGLSKSLETIVEADRGIKRLGAKVVGLENPFVNAEFYEDGLEYLGSASEYWEGIQAKAERRMLGEIGGLRWTWRKTNEIGFSVAQFVVAGHVGGQAGIQILLGMGANTIARDVYEETGSMSQAIIAGTMNYTVTNLLFGAANRISPTMAKDVDDIILGLDTKVSQEVGKEVLRGNGKAVTSLLVNATGIEATTVGARSIEMFVNAAYQNIIQPENRYAAFELSYENFMAQLGHWVEEGLVISLLPGATKGAAVGIRPGGVKNARIEFRQQIQVERAMRVYKGLAEETNGVSVERLEKLVETLEALPEGQGGMFLTQVKEALRSAVNAAKSGDGKVEAKSIKLELSEMTPQQITAELKKFSDTFESIIGDTTPNKSLRVLPPASSAGLRIGKDGKVKEKLDPVEEASLKDGQKVETTEERFDRHQKESEAEINKAETAEGRTFTKEQTKRLRKSQEIEVKGDALIRELFEADVADVVQALRVEVEKIESAGVKSTESEIALEAHKRALNHFENKLNEAGIKEPATGRVKTEINKRLEESFPEGVEAVEKLLRKRKLSAKESAEVDRVMKLLKEIFPEIKTKGKMAKTLKEARKAKVPTVEELAKKTEALTLEEQAAAIKAREKDAAERATNASNREAMRGAGEALKQSQRDIKKRVKDKELNKKEAIEARSSALNALLHSLPKGLVKKLGLRDVVREKDARGKPVVRTQRGFDSAVKKIIKKLNEHFEKERVKNLNAELNKRTEAVDTRLEPVLDNMLKAIIKIIQPGRAKELKIDKFEAELDVAVDVYFDRQAEIFGKSKELDAQKDAVFEILSKAKKSGFESLNDIEASYLLSFTKSLRSQHKAEVRINRQIEKDNLNRDKNDIANEVGTTMVKGAVGDALIANQWIGDLLVIGRDFTFGIMMNSRLADAIEYISGGNKTVAYRVMVEDVQQGISKSREFQREVENVLGDILRKNGIDIENIYNLTDISQVGRDSSKTISFSDGGSVTFTSGQLIRYLMHARDASTAKMLTEGKNGISIERITKRGKKERNIEEITEERHNEILEQSRGTEEARIADSFIEFLNDARVVEPLREYLVAREGHDMISGDTWCMRKLRRRSEKVERKEAKAEDPTSLFEELFSDLGAGTSRLDPSLGKKRTGGKHDIVIDDAVSSVNRFVRSLSSLIHLEKPLQNARAIVKSGRVRNAINNETSREIFDNLERNYYNAIARAERGVGADFGSTEIALRNLRNKVQWAGLAFNPAIPVYQPLSVIPAAIFMGRGGTRDISRATKQMTLDRGENTYENVTRRGIDNSGLMYDRFVTANATSIASGQMGRTGDTTVAIGGQRFGSESLGMRGITGADRRTVAVLYRATELNVARKLKGRGIDSTKPENQAMFKKLVKKQFEALLTETQPMFNPAWQPAINNLQTTSTALSYVNMYRGYVGKLVSMQRISVTRAVRAWENGNYKEAAQHLIRGAGMTLISSALVPIIRNMIKFALIEGGASLLGADRDLGEEFMTTAEKSVFDIIGQITGMPISGDLVGNILQASIQGETPHDPSLSPATEALEASFSVLGRLFSQDPTERSRENWGKLTFDAFRTGGAVSGTVPGILPNTLKKIWDAINESYEKEMKQNLRRAL